eukprot:TRINITY_DN2776_c0_g1_i1.p1 TRINITY_DN2776_c0_g1~~TRINITY_DN2776_c0_g1_i1.p1  ORF type:complete len:229 (+),score=50.49 TRINITY_DN2776_c0_g1_i1:120-806(+)
MVREGTTQHEYRHPWSLVTAAIFAKYPNPFAKHVLTEDVLQRWIDDEGRLHSKRLLSKTNRKPKWMDMWLPDTTAWIVEESIVDPKTKEMTMNTHNVSLNYFMFIEENAIVSANRDGTTQFASQSRVSSSLPIARMVESFGMSRYQRNATKATKGVEWTLANRPLYQTQTIPAVAATQLATSISGAVPLPLSVRQWITTSAPGAELLQLVDETWLRLQQQWEQVKRLD